MVLLGSRGPVPKRSDQRVRRNKDEVPVESVSALGTVKIPELGFDDPHPLIVDLFRSLSSSAQSKYYEPSDWQFARFTLHFANQLLKSGRPSAQLLAAVNQALTDLLVTEGSRRRVRLEIERNQSDGAVIDIADLFRQKLAE
ncbi:phage terminase small subunit [Nocardia sp. IFM 10818]